MKKLYSMVGLVAFAAISLTSCTKQEFANDETVISEGQPFEIIASALDTKTKNDNLTTSWTKGDQLNVFHAIADETTYVSDNSFALSDSLSGKFTGTLSGEITNGANYDWYVMYPYSSYMTSPVNTSNAYFYFGSRSDNSQTQNGNDSKAHLSGDNSPLWGQQKGVASDNAVSVTMHHAAAAVCVTVKNTTSEDLTVSNVKFYATEDIIGTFYVDISGDSPIYTAGNYTSSTASLDVTDATALATNESASYYLGIKPFTASSGSALSVEVNGYKKDISLDKDVTFSAGKIKKISFDFNEIQEPPIYTLEFSKLTTGTNFSSYIYSHEVESNDVAWDVYGNQSQGDNIRVGGKNTTATNRTLTAKDCIVGKINKVVINHSGLTNGKDSEITINSINVEVSDASDFSTKIETVTKVSPSVTSAGALEFTPSEVDIWPNMSYFRITVNYQITGSNNSYITINNVEFFGETVPVVNVTGVSLDKNSASIDVGSTTTLVASVSPDDATNKKFTWESNNTDVATVDDDGVVTGVAAGTATITATTKDGGYTATCDVTVNAVSVTGINLDKSVSEVPVGNTVSITATVVPSNATNKSVTWTSSNTDVATVADGVVTGVAAGTATITATTEDGNYTETCNITVTSDSIWSYEVSSGSPSLTEGTSITINEAVWSITMGTKNGSPDANGAPVKYSSVYGWKWGNTSSKYWSSYTLSTDFFKEKKVKSVTVNFLNNGSKSGTMVVKQGDTTIGTASQTFGQNWTDLTANTTQGSSGTLTIQYTVAQASYIHSITVVYTD